ncbi:MAG: hypothetical protein EPN20_04980 [Magnetospirillum sp.]|nr:MAG: hypothetical protein EPN20_04980 [Magnetospirillum sp.]
MAASGLEPAGVQHLPDHHAVRAFAEIGAHGVVEGGVGRIATDDKALVIQQLAQGALDQSERGDTLDLGHPQNVQPAVIPGPAQQAVLEHSGDDPQGDWRVLGRKATE